MKVNIKEIRRCDKCRKAFQDMTLKCEFLSYGKIICNNCYLKESQPDAE